MLVNPTYFISYQPPYSFKKQDKTKQNPKGFPLGSGHTLGSLVSMKVKLKKTVLSQLQRNRRQRRWQVGGRLSSLSLPCMGGEL